MSILRGTRRQLRKQAEDTSGDVSDAAASGNTANPNEPWTRKAKADPRIEWFKRNPDKLKGYFVNAGGLVGFVVGTGKVGNTNMTGLKIRDAHGKVDVADLSSLKSVSSDPDLDRKSGVPTQEVESKEKAARPAMRKAGNFLPDRSRVPDQTNVDRGRTPQFPNGAKPGDKITTRLYGSFSATYTLRSKTNPANGGTEFYYQWSAMGEQSRSDDEYPTMRELNQALANTHRIQMQESKEEEESGKAARPDATKAAVIDPKIAVLGTPFEARARIINKTNGRLLKSREFKGRFAKASARAWAEAEVRKLL